MLKSLAVFLYCISCITAFVAISSREQELSTQSPLQNRVSFAIMWPVIAACATGEYAADNYFKKHGKSH